MSQLIISYTNIIWYVNQTPPPSERNSGKFFYLCLKYCPCLVKNYRITHNTANDTVSQNNLVYSEESGKHKIQML